jgi:hypothetical protein
MLPWTLLFSSGVEDLGTVTRRAWIFWGGITLALALLYYLEHNMSSSVLTKAAIPLVATACGLMPHIVRRINFVFTVFSFAAGTGRLVLARTGMIQRVDNANRTIGLPVCQVF